MVTNDISKVLTLFQGIDSRNLDLATKHVNPNKYTEHNPYAADGIEGLKDYIRNLPSESHLKVLRAFQDGPYVFTQAEGQILDQGVFFDIFKLEDARIIEHWSFSAPAGPPNKSGHTQSDGPIQASHLENTAKNKAFIRDYYETFHISGKHEDFQKYFAGDLCIRHEPGVKDGVAAFMKDVAIAMQHRTIDEIALLMGQGDFVFLIAKGTHEGEPCAYVDLYRVEDGKLVEHWGSPAKVPPRSKWKNDNGMF